MRPTYSSRQMIARDAQTHVWSLLVINCHLPEMPHTANAPHYTLQWTHSVGRTWHRCTFSALHRVSRPHALAASLNRHIAGALLLVSLGHLHAHMYGVLTTATVTGRVKAIQYTEHSSVPAVVNGDGSPQS